MSYKTQTIKIGLTKVRISNEKGSLVVYNGRREVRYGEDAYGEGQVRGTYARQIIREAGMSRPQQDVINKVAKAIDNVMSYESKTPTQG